MTSARSCALTGAAAAHSLAVDDDALLVAGNVGDSTTAALSLSLTPMSNWGRDVPSSTPDITLDECISLLLWGGLKDSLSLTVLMN